MKLKQLIKQAACVVAFSAFAVGCGGDAAEEAGPEDNTPPPTGPTGPGGEESEKEGGGAEGGGAEGGGN